MSETEKEKRSAMTEAQWAEAKVLWELGDTKLEELSARYGIDKASLSRGFKRRGIMKGSRSREIAEAAAAGAIEGARSAAEEIAKERQTRIRETKEFYYKTMKALADATMGLVVKASKEGRAFSSIKGDLQAMNLAVRTLADARTNVYTVLDIEVQAPTEDELPELRVVEMSANDIEQERERLSEFDGLAEGYSAEIPDDLIDDEDEDNEVVVLGEEPDDEGE